MLTSFSGMKTIPRECRHPGNTVDTTTTTHSPRVCVLLWGLLWLAPPLQLHIHSRGLTTAMRLEASRATQRPLSAKRAKTSCVQLDARHDGEHLTSNNGEPILERSTWAPDRECRTAAYGGGKTPKSYCSFAGERSGRCVRAWAGR